MTDYIARLNFSDLENKTPSPQPPIDYSARLGEIDRQIGKLIDLYQVGSIPIETISKKIEILSKEKSTLEEAARQKSTPSSSLKEMITARSTFMSIIKTGTLEEKRACLTLLIDRIVIDDDNVNIILHKI